MYCTAKDGFLFLSSRLAVIVNIYLFFFFFFLLLDLCMNVGGITHSVAFVVLAIVRILPLFVAADGNDRNWLGLRVYQIDVITPSEEMEEEGGDKIVHYRFGYLSDGEG